MASRIGLEAAKAIAGASACGVTLLLPVSFYRSEVLGDDTDQKSGERSKAGSSKNGDYGAPFSTRTRPGSQLLAFRPFGILRTSCDAEKNTANISDDDDGTAGADDHDEYPNLSRHGKASLLRKHLTPEVFELLRGLKTSSGVTLEDMVRGGVALPLGRNPPRGVGVYAGDAECYSLFSPLLYPIINDYHKTNLSSEEKKWFNPRLKRHSTNLNPEFVLSQRPDPTGNYILYTRMRTSRSIKGFSFAPSLSRSDRRKVERLVRSCVSDWKDDPWLGTGKYKSVFEMTNQEHADLVQRHIMFYNPDEWAVGAGLGRDWPDGRGMFCNVDDYDEIPDMFIWCNAEDHIRISSTSKGGDIKSVFASMSKAVQAIDKSLQRRGYLFAYDDNLGFLNACPTNLGTGLRVHVFVKLVRLGRDPGFEDLVKRLRLQSYGSHGVSDQRYTGIFDICNSERLGKNEVELINIIIQGVGKLIALEQQLERGETVDCSKEH